MSLVSKVMESKVMESKAMESKVMESKVMEKRRSPMMVAKLISIVSYIL